MQRSVRWVEWPACVALLSAVQLMAVDARAAQAGAGAKQAVESPSTCALLTAAEVQRYFGPSASVDPKASGDDEDASDPFVSGPIHNGACVWKLPGSKIRELELNVRWLPAPPELPQLAYGTAGASVFDKPEPAFVPGLGDTANYEARESLPGFGVVMFSLHRGRIIASLSGKLPQGDLVKLAGIVAKRL